MLLLLAYVRHVGLGYPEHMNKLREKMLRSILFNMFAASCLFLAKSSLPACTHLQRSKIRAVLLMYPRCHRDRWNAALSPGIWIPKARRAIGAAQPSVTVTLPSDCSKFQPIKRPNSRPTCFIHKFCGLSCSWFKATASYSPPVTHPFPEAIL